jgi:hypothetical protein
MGVRDMFNNPYKVTGLPMVFIKFVTNRYRKIELLRIL